MTNPTIRYTENVTTTIEKCEKHKEGTGYIFWQQNEKTSAVSTTDWIVETQLCRLRGTSHTFVGRAAFYTPEYFIELHMRFKYVRG